LITIGGIHHITSIAADPKRTEKFYAGTLGLHLVRRTVNFDEPCVLHFYFGDRRGSPGSMITFFVHEAEPPGRCGPGHVSSIVFAVPRGTLMSWRHRLIERGADVTGSAWSFGEECVCFRDPGAVFRFLDGPPDRPIAVDLLCTPTHRPGHAGPGVAHHVALRVADGEALGRLAAMLTTCGFDVTPALDRQYFQAIYFRGPCGVNFAVATDGSGFAIEVQNQRSGDILSLPPWLEPKRATIEHRLRAKSGQGPAVNQSTTSGTRS
jgi:catechol 2,3-dioxygenase-like lactoylglutathione lyase family enzyme